MHHYHPALLPETLIRNNFYFELASSVNLENLSLWTLLLIFYMSSDVQSFVVVHMGLNKLFPENFSPKFSVLNIPIINYSVTDSQSWN